MTFRFGLQSKKRDEITILDILNILICGSFAFICIYPLYYILINSLSSPGAVVRGVFFYPLEFTLRSYNELWNIPGIQSSVIISILRTVVGSVYTTFCSSFAAYILTRRHLPFRKAFYRFFIVTMYINAGFIANYLLITSLGLRNNFLVYILPYGVSAFYIILIKTYIESMAASVWESAEIDGAGVARIYFSIILPLAKPILACIIIFAAVFQWNAWADNLFFISGSRGRHLNTLQYLLYINLQSALGAAFRETGGEAGVLNISPTTLRMAMTFITVLPILCVYPFMQRHFTKGIMLGAVKG